MLLMYGFIAIFVVAIVVGQWITRGLTWSANERVEALFISLFGGFVASLVWALVIVAVSLFTDSHSEDTWSADLQQVTMGKQTHGLFFLGSGYIDGSLKYYMYYKNDDGSYQAWDVWAQDAEVVETDDAPPHVQEHTWYEPSWLMPSWGGMDEDDYTYTIYVPKGSIKPMINMDLPNE